MAVAAGPPAPAWLGVPGLSPTEAARSARIALQAAAGAALPVVGNTTMQVAPPGADLRLGPYLLNAGPMVAGMPGLGQGQRFVLAPPIPAGVPNVVVDIFFGDDACLASERAEGLPNAMGQCLIQVAIYLNGLSWRPNGTPRFNVIV